MIEGLVVREFSPMSSNWRSTEVALMSTWSGMGFR